MKKSILYILSAAMIFGGALSVSAQSASTTAPTAPLTVQEQIAQLMAQIEQLKAQLAAMQKSNTDLQATVDALQISTRLKPGMRGEDVKHLQEVLSTDKDVLSKENVTGYYGPMTEEAVKIFQKHFGIDPAGIVGPATLKKINEILKEHNAHEQDLLENELGDLGDLEDANEVEGENDHGNFNNPVSTTTPTTTQHRDD